MSLFYRSGLIILASSLLFITCNNKKTEEPILGKWIFKEFIYEGPKDSVQQKKNIEEDKSASGTVFIFNEDRTFSVAPGNKREEIMTGTWSLKNNGRLVMNKNGDPVAQTAVVSFPENDLLKLEHAAKDITIVLERVK